MDIRPIDGAALVADLNRMAEECIAMEKHVPIEFKQYYRGKFEAVMDIMLQVSRHTPTIDCVPRQQWISVKDMLPEEGEKVLVRGIKGGIQAGVFRGLSAPSRERMWHWKKNTCLEVVCWMSQKSLPEPPKEECK